MFPLRQDFWRPRSAMTATLPSTAITMKAPPRSEDLWIAATFAIKTFVAGLLALYVAFWLGLDEPRWALMTVYVVAQPEGGLVLAKSFYRALGTAAGILVSTLLVFTFAQYGELFVALLALWTGICNFAARAARNFTSYGFLLAGYTVAIVGIPAALNPTAAYTIIVARGTEIAIGIIFAALASRLLFPQDCGRISRSRLRRYWPVPGSVCSSVLRLCWRRRGPVPSRAATG